MERPELMVDIHFTPELDLDQVGVLEPGSLEVKDKTSYRELLYWTENERGGFIRLMLIRAKLPLQQYAEGIWRVLMIKKEGSTSDSLFQEVIFKVERVSDDLEAQ